MSGENLIGKIPPQNTEAEAAVLGAVLVNKEAMDKVADILLAEDFYSQGNQTIFRAILRLYEKRSPIDLVTLTNDLEGVKELDQIGGAAYLADLVNSVPTALHVVHYAQIVKQKSVLRRVLAAGQQIAQLGYDEDKEIQEIMDEAESALFAVSHKMISDNFLPIADILAASFDRIDRLHREKGLLRGVTSGFKELDNKLSGFQPSDLIILAARPSMGKCVAGQTQILNPKTGATQTIKELVESEQGEVATLDDNWQFQSVKPERFVADGVKPTFKVVTASGREIEATLPHPFLTKNGWIKLAEVKIGDEVAVAKSQPILSDHILSVKADILWDKIVSIESAGMQPVYDLTVSGTHNFVANDFIVHNTTLALNFALNAAVKAKVPVGFFSLEQSREQIVDRLLCAQAMVDGWKLRTGNLSESDFPAIGMAMGTLAEAPIFIDDSPLMTPIEIRTRARRLQADKQLGLIIVDYLQLLEARRGYGGDNRVQEVSEISRSLKAIARELNVPVIALSQLSRAVESRDKKIPQLSDLRESGCLSGRTKIVRADTGEITTMRELAEREAQSPVPVFSLDENYKIVVKPMTKVFSSGQKQLFALKTQSGRMIEASANHPFRKIDDWHRLDELVVGDRVALPRLVKTTQTVSAMLADELVLLAHLLGDGCVIPHQPIHYTSADPANLAAVEKAALNLFGIKARLVQQKNWWHLYLPSPFRLARGKHHPIVTWFNKLGLKMARSYEKVLPSALFLSTEKDIALFLKHLWATDGNVSWKKLPGRMPAAAIYYSSTSQTLIEQIQHLLLRLGVQSSYRLVPNKGYRPSHQVHVQGNNQQFRFLEIVGCFGERGKIIPELQWALSQITTNPNVDILPTETWALAVEPAKAAVGMSWRTVSAAIETNYSGSSLFKSGIGRDRLSRLAEATNSLELGNLANSDVFWDEIISITPLGVEEVYDATVPGTHNFLADDIIVHNSIEQDADVVMFMYREEYYERETERKGITDVLIRKHRNGPIGEVELHFKAEHARFYDIDRKKIAAK